MDAESDKHPDEVALCMDETVSATDAFIGCFETLKRVAAGLGLGRDDVQDVLQDVFVQAAKHGSDLPARQATAWLVRVTVNRALLEHRQRKRFRDASQRMAKERRNRETAAPDHLAEQAEALVAIRRGMRELDEALLMVMTLRYFTDMDSTEIGRTLGIPPATVRRQLHDARLILAKRLIAEGFGP